MKSIRSISSVLLLTTFLWSVSTGFAQSVISTEGKPASSRLAPAAGQASSATINTTPMNVAPINLPNLRAQSDSHHDHDHGAGTGKPRSATLLGVEPGHTTLIDLQKETQWKTPTNREVVDNFLVLTYKMDEQSPMLYIQILLRQDTVQGVVVHLREGRELGDARESFIELIRNVRPLVLVDPEGKTREIYPEKGLVFVLAKSDDDVSAKSPVEQIIVEAVNPDYYIIRAEQELPLSMTNAWSDASFALAIDPENATANWFMAILEKERGNWGKAREYALKAVKLDKEKIQYQLTLIEILTRLQQVEMADKLHRLVEPAAQGVTWLESELAILGGDIQRLINDSDLNNAINLHQKALAGVKTFLEDTEQDIRIPAKKMVIRANMALARDYALLGETGTKGAFDALERATRQADDLVKNENHDMVPLWEICLVAIEVGQYDPLSKSVDPYIQTLKRLAGSLIADKEKATGHSEGGGDTFAVSMLENRTAKAFYEATLIYEARDDNANVADCATRALGMVEQLQEKNPNIGDLLKGKILYQLGTINSQNAPAEMANRYREAAQIFQSIDSPLSGDDMYETGQIVVNMSNYFWKQGDKEVAVELTLQGTELLEGAIGQGIGEVGELYVPYQNLSTMYKNIGQEDQAQKYAQLAAQCQKEQ